MPVRRVVAGVGLAVVAGVAFVVLRDGGTRGEPFAVATIERPLPKSATSAPPARVNNAPAIAFTASGPAAPELSQGQVVEIENGVTVVRPAGGSGPVMLKVPDPAAAVVTTSALAKAPDPRLVESGSFGPLPRVGRDGTRPDHVYAHAAVAAGDKPRIAILVGGMGLDRQATSEAGSRLPNAVSFGFAPYGDDLADQVRTARQAGHEVILQMPMEGFGQGETTLSHMLLTEGRNGDRLRWLMSRFTGYAGVGNYLGGRLLADEDALRPVLQETASRGLFFVDDGSAARSLAVPLADELHLPVTRADVILDAKPDAGAIAAAFVRLEALARERGSAIGSATGRPETTDLLSHLLAEAETRGIVLVPLSQMASQDTSPTLASRGAAPR